MKTALILRKGQVSLNIERMLVFKKRRRASESRFLLLNPNFCFGKYIDLCMALGKISNSKYDSDIQNVVLSKY